MRPSAIDYSIRGSIQGTMLEAALYGTLDDATLQEHRVELLEALKEYKRLIDVSENDILNDNIDR